MYHVRVSSPLESTPHILEVLGTSSGALNVTVHPGSARYPDGDVVECDLVPEAASAVIHQLRELGPRQRGPISVDRTEMAVIRSHREMIRPMVSDREIAPVWEVVDATIRANAAYPFSFFLLLVAAGLIAAVGILTNSQILIVATMVLGPEYSAILGAALGITQHNVRPVKRGLVALGIGFGAAVVITWIFSSVIRWTGQAPATTSWAFGRCPT